MGLCTTIVAPETLCSQDIGFGGVPPELGLDDTVLNHYFSWYFPLAVRLGRWFEAAGGKEAHIYTAHAYVASLYLSCPPGAAHCALE